MSIARVLVWLIVVSSLGFSIVYPFRYLCCFTLCTVLANYMYMTVFLVNYVCLASTVFYCTKTLLGSVADSMLYNSFLSCQVLSLCHGTAEAFFLFESLLEQRRMLKLDPLLGIY